MFVLGTFLSARTAWTLRIIRFSCEETLGELVCVYSYTIWDNKSDRYRFFSEVCSERQWTQTEIQKILLEHQKHSFHRQGYWTLEQVAQRDYGDSILGDIQNPAGHRAPLEWQLVSTLLMLYLSYWTEGLSEASFLLLSQLEQFSFTGDIVLAISLCWLHERRVPDLGPQHPKYIS